MRKWLLAAAGAALLCACAPDFGVYDLRCEGLVEPLGIDSGEPHFSWKIRSGAPMEQVAYEIEVGPERWSSGRVPSSDQVMVPYGGKPLSSRQHGWWRVRVWRSETEVSDWSPKQRFGVGIIGEDRLKGEYVGGVPGAGREPLLRKTFQVEKTGTALLYVNSLGYHEAFLNGKKVSDAVLAPAVSQLDRRSQIVVYDVSGFLKAGENELLIAASSGWYKPTTFRAAYEGPLVKAELDVDGKPLVWTDGTWEAGWSGYRDLGTWRPHEFIGERIEAGVEPQWTPVDVVPVEGLTASMQMCEPAILMEEMKPVEIRDLGNGSWRIDFGQVVNALFAIELPSLPAGHLTRATFSDVDAEVYDWEICGYDEYVSSGRPAGDSFRNRFNHHVFRYVQLDSLPAAPVSVSAFPIRAAFSGTGAGFLSSDEDLNRIENLVHRTVENLAFDGYMVDCASIERLGYGGDGNASAQTLFTLADAAPTLLNWLQAWADAQRPDGGLPHTAPNPYTAGGGPYWCSFLIQAAWRTYQNSADQRSLERFYPQMRHWLDYVDTYTVDGLLKQWPNTEYRGWYLGDWAAPKGVDVQDPVSIDLVNNCALCQSYLALEQIARTLGRDEDAADCRRRYEALKNRIQETFYQPETGIYGSGSQVDMVYPLLVGVVPDSLKERVVAVLKERTETVYGGHLATGLVGVPVLTEWATREGECDWLYCLLKQPGYPGYLFMLDSGATGVWEEWDGGRSHLHNCYNGIGSWFYQSLGGIVPDQPGYRHVIIDPQRPDGLDWVKVKQDTPYGVIEVDRTGDALVVTLPVGVKATIRGQEYGNGVHHLH